MCSLLGGALRGMISVAEVVKKVLQWRFDIK